MRNRFAAALAGCALALSAGVALAADGFNELYRLAADSDPAIKRAEARLGSVRADVGIVDTRYYPKLSGSAAVTQVSQTLDDAGNSARSSSVAGYNFGLTGVYSLYDPKTANALGSLDYDAKGAEFDIRTARNELASRFTDAYFNVLRAREDLRIANEEAARIKAILEQANAFLKAGTGDIIAVHEARARYDGVAADLTRFENQLTLAQKRLSLLVGREVSDVVDYRPEKVSGPEPDDLDWWISALEKNDPALKAVNARLEKAAYDTEKIADDYSPVYQAFAGYNVSYGTPFDQTLLACTWNMGLGVTVPIYTGGEVDARVARGVSAQAEQRHFLSELRRQRLDYLKLLFYDLKYGVSLVNSLKLRRESVEAQLTAVRKGREIGTRTAIDLLNAEEAYSLAERDLRKALYDNAVRSVQLKCLVGIVDEAELLPGLRAVFAEPSGK